MLLCISHVSIREHTEYANVNAAYICLSQFRYHVVK